MNTIIICNYILLINKILLCKLFFTETNSHHTVQILTSFIIMHYTSINMDNLYGVQQYYLILYSCSILQHENSNLSYSWALHNYMQKFMRNIMKKFWLRFRIHGKFRAKQLFISNEFRAKLVSYWYENYVKFCAQPRNCCARESTVSWKP